jgi:hypothetical protein
MSGLIGGAADCGQRGSRQNASLKLDCAATSRYRRQALTCTALKNTV